MTTMTRDEYINKVTDWAYSRESDEMKARILEAKRLDGVYTGKSKRIRDLVRLAYMRGVRAGAGMAWEAQQKMELR